MLNLSAVNDNKDVATKEYVDGKAAVTGVKGNSESSYRTGNVNLTAANIGAAAASHTHSTQQLYYPSSLVGMTDVALRPMVNTTRANRLAFLPADQIIIEQTTDGGATWTDAGVADSTKVGLFSETRASVNLPRLNGTTRSNLCGLRITITAMKYTVPPGTAETAKYNYWTTANVTAQERYTNLDSMYFWLGSNGDKIGVKVECANASTPTTWITCFDNPSFGLTGWSGNSYISFSNRAFGGGTNQTSQPWNWRITLMTMYANGSSAYSNTAQQIIEIRGYGTSWWGGQNNYMKNDHLYTWDWQLNATFPKQLTATQFNGALNGTATTATNVSGAAAYSNTTARHIWFSDSATETKRAYSDSCTYVASTNTISANISGNAATATTATSATSATTATNATNAANADKVNNLTVQTAVPANAVFTDTQSDWNATSGKAVILNKPTIPTVPSAYTSNPSMNGTASAGSSTQWAKGDHVHPVDTSRAASSHSHGSITNAGAITSDTTVATGDKIIISDSSDSSKLKRSGISFSTTDSGTFLCHNGTWATPSGGGTTAADYIVEQGTSGGWVYRKYNSGVAECWRQWTQSAIFNDHSGNGWFSSGFYASFPSGLFNSAPEFCNISGVPSSAGFFIEYGTGLSSTRTQTVWLGRVEGGTSSSETVGLCAHAIGTWK